VVSARDNRDSFLASAMPVLLTAAYFVLMGWVFVAGGAQ
jgi:hypothetical protein